MSPGPVWSLITRWRPQAVDSRYSTQQQLKILKFRFPIIRNDSNLFLLSRTEQSPCSLCFPGAGGWKRKRSSTMKESEILKFICANQGAVNTDELLYNLNPGDSTDFSEIILQNDQFALCHPFGQPKVVARTSLKLCRARDCQGSCKGLHMCKNFLFSGSCKFTQTR